MDSVLRRHHAFHIPYLLALRPRCRLTRTHPISALRPCPKPRSTAYLATARLTIVHPNDCSTCAPHILASTAHQFTPHTLLCPSIRVARPCLPRICGKQKSQTPAHFECPVETVITPPTQFSKRHDRAISGRAPRLLAPHRSSQ
jgi:hypothetical protein